MKTGNFIFALAVCVVSAEAAIIPADRLPLPGTWESAGVEGGIPNRQTLFADVAQAPYNVDRTGATSAVLAIQSAINNCPVGQVVYVPAGTYRIDNPLVIRKSITLRGAGTNTTFSVPGGLAVRIGGLGPWPPPKNNASYSMAITGGSTRSSTTVNVSNTSSIAVGKMVMVSETDDPSLVWTKSGFVGRHRASMHMVESKSAGSVTFRPPLQIDFLRSPQLAWFPDLTQNAGVEDIRFVGTGTNPGNFITIESAWNCWVQGCEFTRMPAKTIMVNWSGHVELRRNYMHDQANGGPNSEGLDLLTDVNWSLVVDNICVAGGFPQINIGDAGAGANYSGGFGNVIAYNYAVDAYYTDPPTSPNHGFMASDIGTDHSPHTQYNLVEGNYMSKFGSDGYHGSGSHSVLFRNVITGRNRWTNATDRIAVQIDRRNLCYSLVGNVIGQSGSPATYEYLTIPLGSGINNSTIYRLGFPDSGNQGFSGTYPPTPIPHSDGGPRDLYVARNNTDNGTTLIEGNWNSVSRTQDWTIAPTTLPDSYFLSSKPSWFGSLAWPPVNPANPITNDPTIIPAGYRYIKGTPLLSIEHTNGSVRVFWPRSATDFVLDQTTNLVNAPQTNSWTQAPLPYQTNATEITITVPAPTGHTFYRLRKP